MRYQEAYELVEAGLVKSALGFPVTEPLIAKFFDAKVQEVGARAMRKVNSQTFTTSATNAYELSNEDASMRIYKVTMTGSNDSKNIPFVSEKRYAEGMDEDLITSIGYFVKEDDATTGSITAMTRANPITVTSSSHGLESGIKVKITNVVGMLPDTGEPSEINDVIHKIEVTDANSFTMPVKGANYQVAYSSGGTWALSGIKVFLTKTPDVGDSLKVYYYANPLPKNAISDSIDLKDTHMLYLNYLPDEWGFSVKVYNDKVFRIKNGCWFMATYLLSWDGAKGLIDRFPIVGPLDTWIQHQYDFLRPLA